MSSDTVAPIAAGAAAPVAEPPAKRSRGRPRKAPLQAGPAVDAAAATPLVKRKPGRPRKNSLPAASSNPAGAAAGAVEAAAAAAAALAASVATTPVVKRKPGRPRKTPLPVASPNAAAAAAAAAGATPPVVKRKPGRPRKTPLLGELPAPGAPSAASASPAVVKRKPGRPRKDSVVAVSPAEAAAAAASNAAFAAAAAAASHSPGLASIAPAPQFPLPVAGGGVVKRGPGRPRMVLVAAPAQAPPMAVSAIGGIASGPVAGLSAAAGAPPLPLPVAVTPAKRKPGRPRKSPLLSPPTAGAVGSTAVAAAASPNGVAVTPPVKRKPGRPRKHPLPSPDDPPKAKRGPGRPRKHPLPAPPAMAGEAAVVPVPLATPPAETPAVVAERASPERTVSPGGTGMLDAVNGGALAMRSTDGPANASTVALPSLSSQRAPPGASADGEPPPIVPPPNVSLGDTVGTTLGPRGAAEAGEGGAYDSYSRDPYGLPVDLEADLRVEHAVDAGRALPGDDAGDIEGGMGSAGPSELPWGVSPPAAPEGADDAGRGSGAVWAAGAPPLSGVAGVSLPPGVSPLLPGMAPGTASGLAPQPEMPIASSGGPPKAPLPSLEGTLRTHTRGEDGRLVGSSATGAPASARSDGGDGRADGAPDGAGHQQHGGL